MGISEDVLMMVLASICIYTHVGTLYVELGFGLRFLMFWMICLSKYFIVEFWFVDVDFLCIFMRWI